MHADPQTGHAPLGVSVRPGDRAHVVRDIFGSVG